MRQNFCKNHPCKAKTFGLPLKGQCHEIFCFRFLSWITFPQAPDNNFKIISNFFENSRRYSQVNVHHRVYDIGGKLLPVSTTSAANLPPVSTTLAANFATSSPCVVDTGGKFATGVNDTGGKFATGVICHLCHWHRWQIMGTISGCWHLKVNWKAKIYTTKGDQTKLLKFFWLKIFSICHRCRWYRW